MDPLLCAALCTLLCVGLCTLLCVGLCTLLCVGLCTLLCIVLCTLLCIVEIATHSITRDTDIYCLSFDLWYCYRRNSILASFNLFHSNERVASASSTFTSSCSHFGGAILNASPTRPYETSPKRAVGLNFVMSMISLSMSTSCARGHI